MVVRDEVEVDGGVWVWNGGAKSSSTRACSPYSVPRIVSDMDALEVSR